jgi:putative peptidoglycan lipid II flippase
MSSDAKQPVNPQTPKPRPSIVRSASLMALGTLASRILGMVRDMVMAAMFNPMITDAFVVAFRLPNLFRRVLGEGSLSASFIPIYVDANNKSESESRQFASAIFSMLTALTATLTALGILFMPQIISTWVSGQGYAEIPGKIDLTIWMARIMFLYFFLVMSYAFLMSIANAHHAFFWAGLAPAAFNTVVIIFAFLPQYRMAGDQLAIGVVVAGFAQLLMTLWPLWRIGRIPTLTGQWLVRGTKRFFQSLLPSMIGMSVGQLLGILNVNFTSQLGQGAHSYIYYADRLLEFPQALMSVSLGVALLPTLSDLWSRGERSQFLSTVQSHVRLLMVVMLPAAVGLYVLAEPIVSAIYARGQFTADAVAATASVTQIYAVVMIVSGLHRVTVPAFYAVKNTWLPAANAIVCLIVHYFVAGWAVGAHGLTGLVWATAFTGAFNLFLLLVSYRLLFGELGIVAFMKSFLWLLPAVAAMAFTARGVYDWLIVGGSVIFSLAIAIICAGIVYFLVAMITRHPEAEKVLARIRRTLFRRASR